MSERIFAYLLRLYPRAFREEYGGAMLQVFEDRLGKEPRFGGRVRLWAELLMDVARSAPREHFRGRPLPRKTGFGLSEDAVAAMVRRSHAVNRMILWTLIGFGAAWLGEAPMWPAFVVYGALSLLAIPAVLGRRAFKRHWQNYSLLLDGDRIDELNSLDIVRSLQRSEISRILETPNFGLAVQACDPTRSIWVPSVITGYGEIRAKLHAWVPVETRDPRGPGFPGHQPLHSVLSLYVAAVLVQSLTVGAVLAAANATWLIWALWSLRRAPAERPGWFGWIFALLLVGIGLKISLLLQVL